VDPGEHVYSLSVYAEYSQFFLGDAAFQPDIGSPAFWNPLALQRRLAVRVRGLMGCGTARYDHVPLEVDVGPQAPPLSDLDAWQHVVEASLNLSSGGLVIDGPISYQPGASFEIRLDPGLYCVRVYYGGLDVPESDHYKLVLWPASSHGPVHVIRALDDRQPFTASY